ncbi:MAG TPA: zf-HC2 domain-containing protein [Longimicrobiales bacterium]|nr:zf-HC2 domain-containing protein [Longimicrobiales bacterium]
MTHSFPHFLIEFADGELRPGQRERLQHHLGECSHCEAALSELKATRTSFASLLAELDQAEPEVWSASVQAIYAPQRVALPVERSSRSQRWRWAAGIVLVSGAAVASATMLRNYTFSAVETEAAPEPAVPAPPPATPSGGVFVDAPGGVARIELSAVAAGTRVSFRVTTDSMIGLHSYGASAPSFVAQSGRIVVRMSGRPAELRLLVPASITQLQVLVDGQRVALIEQGRLRVTASDRRISFEVAEP